MVTQFADLMLHKKPDTVRRRKRRDPRWEDESFHWLPEMWAEYHMHPQAKCRTWYGHVRCFRHNLMVVDE